MPCIWCTIMGYYTSSTVHGSKILSILKNIEVMIKAKVQPKKDFKIDLNVCHGQNKSKIRFYIYLSNFKAICIQFS